MVDFSDIKAAHERIKPMINKTPVMTSRTLSQMVQASVYVKCENFQRIGAFKFRGAINKLSLLTEEEKKKGVITHSSGNHAQALALASTLMGIKSVIVMPDNAPEVKVNATKGYGAEIVRCASSVESREKTCMDLIQKYGYTLVHPYDDDQIIAGAGTAAKELIEEIGVIDYMFCPIGGGGLISGTSISTKALCPNAIMIGVEPKRADDAFRDLRDNIIHPSSYPDTIADGLRTALCERTFNIIKKNVDRIITVSEREIVNAMEFLFTRMKIVVEPSGAVPIAGILKISHELKDKKVGAIISGGNIDLSSLFNKYHSMISGKED